MAMMRLACELGRDTFRISENRNASSYSMILRARNAVKELRFSASMKATRANRCSFKHGIIFPRLVCIGILICRQMTLQSLSTMVNPLQDLVPIRDSFMTFSS